MIPEEYRFFVPLNNLIRGGPSSWYILDWDQRRSISLTINKAVLPGHEEESEELAIAHLKKYIESIDTDIYAIECSPEGSLISTSTNPQDDITFCPYYPPLAALQEPHPKSLQTVLRSELVELDRFMPNVDLVSWCKSESPRPLVFKYYFLDVFARRTWEEINIWSRLPSDHPHIVPFDRVVLDESSKNVIGFTALFIPGGTLDEPVTPRPFKIKWLRQLIRVIDDLNFSCGIMHQDVAPRNLLVDPNTDDLMIFDFNFSCQIGTNQQEDDRDDVKGVILTMYEIVTGQEVDYLEQNMTDVLEKEWIQHPSALLEGSVVEYRSILRDWLQIREEAKQASSSIVSSLSCQDISRNVAWPQLPEPPVVETILKDIDGNDVVISGRPMAQLRRELQKTDLGKTIVTWERPLQAKTTQGSTLLATGKYK